MTREEAIQELIYAQEMCPFDPLTGEHEALGMAIRSLEAWDEVIKEIESFQEETKNPVYKLAFGSCLVSIEEHLKLERAKEERLSYDIYLGVRIHGTDQFAIIGEPEYNSPTYNLGNMFRACMDWDFDQGEWYKVVDVLPNIERGIHELAFNRKKYEKYNPSNGWGSIESALKCLESLKTYIQHHVDGWEQDIPIEHLYVRW